MLDHQRRRRLPRLILLLAGLLYLVGAAAEPLVHAQNAHSSDAGNALVVVTSDGAGTSDPSIPHADSECLACKIAGQVLLPDAGPAVVEHLVGDATIFLRSSCSRAPPPQRSPRPRAPPLV